LKEKKKEVKPDLYAFISKNRSLFFYD